MNAPDKPGDSLSFQGCWNDAYPRFLAKDRRLSAVEVRVWLILKTRIQEHQTTRFDYDDIMADANLGSRSTLSKALKILQATRWIYVATRRDPVTGQMQGNEYALLDSPASVTETCRINGNYISLLEAMAIDSNTQLREVARFELEMINEAIRTGRDPDDMAKLAQDNGPDWRDDGGDSAPVQKLDSAESKNWTQPPSTEIGLGRVQKLDSLCSSSIYNNKTTTTNIGVTISTRDKILRDLEFPESFTAAEKQISAGYLAKVKENERQIILDELAAKIRTGPQSGNPVKNPLGYLNWLCNQALKGELPISSASLRAKANRERAKAQKKKSEDILQQGLQRAGLDDSHPADGPLAKKAEEMARKMRGH